MYCVLILGIAYEIYHDDYLSKIKLLILNGWVEYNDPKSGILSRSYVGSLSAKQEDILKINLAKVDSIIAFSSLKCISVVDVNEVISMKPLLSLNKNDSVFIIGEAVIDAMSAQTNLSSMN